MNKSKAEFMFSQINRKKIQVNISQIKSIQNWISGMERFTSSFQQTAIVPKTQEEISKF
jgi:hypothetical protein